MSCCVPFCDSKRKKSTFGVPQDLDLCKVWNEALGFTLKSKSRVCENHFNPQDITREWVSGQGTSKYTIHLKQPRLKNGAVPQKVLKLQPIVENSIGPNISQNNLINPTSSTISNLNYTPLKKKQKINKHFNIRHDHCYSQNEDITTVNRFNINIDDECPKAGNSNSVSPLNNSTIFQSILKAIKMINILNNAIHWLNEWELNLEKGLIKESEFLTKPTSEGLRITLTSTIQLVKYLLNECGFSYVLTAKFNQDSLEKFFGIIRQVSGPNDHPTAPTFLQLYLMLSVYSVIKPPKTGNCTIFEDSIPVLSIKDLKEIINDPENISERTKKIELLKGKINKIIEDDCWDLDDVLLEHNYANSTVFDCVVYFMAGYIAKRLVKSTKCQLCIVSIKNLNTSSVGTEADLLNNKSRGYLTHPDRNLYWILKHLETCFSKHAASHDVFENTYNEFFSMHIAYWFKVSLFRTPN